MQICIFAISQQLKWWNSCGFLNIIQMILEKERSPEWNSALRAALNIKELHSFTHSLECVTLRQRKLCSKKSPTETNMWLFMTTKRCNYQLLYVAREASPSHQDFIWSVCPLRIELEPTCCRHSAFAGAWCMKNREEPENLFCLDCRKLKKDFVACPKQMAPICIRWDVK